MGSEGVSVKTEDACEGSNPTARLPIVNDQENCLAGEPLLEDSLPLTVLRNNHQAYGDLDLKTSLANEQERQQLPTHVSGGLQHNSEQQLPVVQPPTAGTTHEQGTLFHTSFGLEGAAPHTGAGGFPHPMHTLPHHDAGVLAPAPLGAPVLVTRPSSAKGSKGPLVCQVQGCSRDLSQEKKYYKRYRVCMDHLKMKAIYVDGELARFCQQCGRFHDLSKFDGQKRNCRERLSQHNRRRRKSKWASISAASDGSWGDTPTPEVKVPRGPRSKRPSQGSDRPRVPGGFWDVADGQAGGVPGAMDVDREEKSQSLTALVQGSYAVGQPSTSGLGTVEGIPVTQGFRRPPVQVGGTRSAFKQFADGTVQGAPADGSQRQDSIYEMLVHQQLQQSQAQSQQALVHVGLPTMPARPPEGVPMDSMETTTNQLTNIPQVPMLLIPAASAAEIMQQLRGSAVALIPTTGNAPGAAHLPIQHPQSGMVGPAVAMQGAHPLALPAPTQWTPQASLPQIPITSVSANPLNPTLLPPTVGAAAFDPSAGVGSSALWRSDCLPASQALNLSQSMGQMSSTAAPSGVPTFNAQPLSAAPEGLAAHHAPSTATAQGPAVPTMSIKEDPALDLPVSLPGLLPTLSSSFQGSNVHVSQSQLATSYSPGQQVIVQGTGPPPTVFPSQDEQLQERFLQLQKIMDGGGSSLTPQTKIHYSSILTQAGIQVPQSSSAIGLSGVNDEGGLVLQPPALIQPPVSNNGAIGGRQVEFSMDCQVKAGQVLPATDNSMSIVSAAPLTFTGANAVLRSHIPNTSPADAMGVNHNGANNN